MFFKVCITLFYNIEYDLFENSKVTEGHHHPRLAMERKFRNSLVDFGFYENISYTLVPSDIADKLLLNDKRKNLIRIANPISEDISCMRTSLAHSLLSNINYNLSVGNRNMKIFECGRVYLTNSLPLTNLPTEKNMIALAICEENKNNDNFFYMKGVVEALLNKTSVKYSLVRSKEPYLHPGISADIVIENNKVIGSFGVLHPTVAKNYNVPEYVVYAELNDDILAGLPVKKYEVKNISKYPIVERDLAIVIDEKVAVQDILDSIKSSCGKLFYKTQLFDIYRNQELKEQNKKSLAFNIKLSDMDKTLTDEEVNKVMQKILKTLSYRFGAVLR